jgi:hypothetical protein
MSLPDDDAEAGADNDAEAGADNDAEAAADDLTPEQRAGLIERIRGLTDGEKAELTALQQESDADRRYYKKTKKESAEYYIREGRRLKRGKEIVGYSWFMPYVNFYKKFSHRTADHYLQIYDAIEIGHLKFATVADLGLKKVIARLAAENEARARSLRDADQPRRSRRRRRGRHRASLTSPEDDRSWAQRQSDDARAHGEPDPHRQWPRPHEDGEVLFIEWRVPDPHVSRRHAYVWLADDAHAAAYFHGSAPPSRRPAISCGIGKIRPRRPWRGVAIEVLE